MISIYKRLTRLQFVKDSVGRSVKYFEHHILGEMTPGLSTSLTQRHSSDSGETPLPGKFRSFKLSFSKLVVICGRCCPEFDSGRKLN